MTQRTEPDAWQTTKQQLRAEQIATRIADELRQAARQLDAKAQPALSRMLLEYAATIDCSSAGARADGRAAGTDAYQPQAWRVLLWTAGGLLRIARQAIAPPVCLAARGLVTAWSRIPTTPDSMRDSVAEIEIDVARANGALELLEQVEDFADAWRAWSEAVE